MRRYREEEGELKRERVEGLGSLLVQNVTESKFEFKLKFKVDFGTRRRRLLSTYLLNDRK